MCTKVHSGNGKSFIVISLAIYYAKHQSTEVIICTLEHLVDQLQDSVNKYCQAYSDLIMVRNITNLEAVKVRGKVLILDEIDYMVRNHMIYFKKRDKSRDNLVISGLINSNVAEKFIMTTATIGEFE